VDDLPLLENDLAAPGVVTPGAMRSKGTVPPDVVLCFFPEAIDDVAARPDARRRASMRTEMGRHQVWELDQAGATVGIAHPGVGAPLAAAMLEELIALGGRRFTVCGAAGALVEELVLGHAVVVDSAVRDEGTSFHYRAPSRVIDAQAVGVDALVAACHRLGAAHTVGRTWTTDAVYRETRERVARRRDEGCVTVEMEAAALLAVADYRDVLLGQVLLAGDSLAGEAWDHRGWTRARDARTALFEVALSAAADQAVRHQGEGAGT
jgi:uridine phosphorylase